MPCPPFWGQQISMYTSIRNDQHLKDLLATAEYLGEAAALCSAKQPNKLLGDKFCEGESDLFPLFFLHGVGLHVCQSLPIASVSTFLTDR